MVAVVVVVVVVVLAAAAIALAVNDRDVHNLIYLLLLTIWYEPENIDT